MAQFVSTFQSARSLFCGTHPSAASFHELGKEKVPENVLVLELPLAVKLEHPNQLDYSGLLHWNIHKAQWWSKVDFRDVHTWNVRWAWTFIQVQTQSTTFRYESQYARLGFGQQTCQLQRAVTTAAQMQPDNPE